MDYRPKDAFEDIDATLELIQDLEDNYSSIWDKGEDFFVDVREKITSVRETIGETARVSPGQESAIENWLRGVQKWHPDYRS